MLAVEDVSEPLTPQQVLETKLRRAVAGRRVVILESNADDFQHLAELFRHFGFSVDGGEDLSDIVAIVRHSSKIDLLVVAADLPVPSAGSIVVDLCKSLHPGVQVLFEQPSDIAMESSDAEAMQEDALRKPLSIAALVGCVLKLFPPVA